MSWIPPPPKVSSNPSERMNMSVKVRAHRERGNFLLHVLYLGCHEKLWPEFRVGLSTSNDPMMKKILHRCTLQLRFYLVPGMVNWQPRVAITHTLCLEGWKGHVTLTRHRGAPYHLLYVSLPYCIWSGEGLQHILCGRLIQGSVCYRSSHPCWVRHFSCGLLSVGNPSLMPCKESQ